MFSFFKTREDILGLDESNRICPVCIVRMHKLVKGDVVIDKCSKCGGIFLDEGELEKLSRLYGKDVMIS